MVDRLPSAKEPQELSEDVPMHLCTDLCRSMNFIKDLKLDDRKLSCDYDLGFTEGRQYGRGRSGGQVPIPNTRTQNTLTGLDSSP